MDVESEEVKLFFCRTSIILRVMRRHSCLSWLFPIWISECPKSPFPALVVCDELIRRKYDCILSFHISNKAHILKQLRNFAQNSDLKSN